MVATHNSRRAQINSCMPIPIEAEAYFSLHIRKGMNDSFKWISEEAHFGKGMNDSFKRISEEAHFSFHFGKGMNDSFNQISEMIAYFVLSSLCFFLMEDQRSEKQIRCISLKLN
ncbi:hypothetical protein AVEN_3226-1 [Araneus ventricosus]|uniref:Vacuolar protein sorting-associated protein 13 VPS13 adaptor binding domain-containing protein n=1 Tax=Araneus ventricosus TaxID=182803 RepID=A0A4Y2G8F8_ARAVE|nr:hypothetical protein AVEN_3226-1 [Araneus ventricosus]